MDGVGNNGTVMAIRVIRIVKLPKRKVHFASAHPAEVQQPPQQPDAFRQEPKWQFPPPLPPPKVYHHNQDNLMQPIGNERASFRKILTNNIGGLWRRMVKKNPKKKVYTIPPELKPQLKHIYVY